MDKTEYIEIKKVEKQWAEGIVTKIQNSKDATVKYKDSRPITDIRDMFRSSVELFGDNVAFHEKPDRNSPYKTITYKEAEKDVNALGTALLALGLKGKRIGIVGENSYKWAVSYLSVVCGVGVVVPLDKELKEEELITLAKRSDMAAIIYTDTYKDVFGNSKKLKGTELKYQINMNLNQSDVENSSKFEKFANKCEEKEPKKIGFENEISFDGLLEFGTKLLESGNREFIDAQVINSEMNIILFTSGTTGVSKGVMLSQKNIACDLMVAPTVLKVNETDIFFSVLPIHHTYECTCGFLMPMYKGASIAYCEGLKYITKNLEEVKPTMFLGVPVLFETLHKKIWANVRKKGKEKVLKKVIKANKVTKKIGIDLGNKFFKDIRAVFGGRMRMMICGGAAINPDVLQGIRDFGIMALQGYGLTECAPMGALNPDTAPKNASIGRSFPACELKVFAANEEGIGEICVKGDNVMMGYYEMEEETSKVIKDGWLHTGDLGKIDSEGYVYITGRAKNVIITKNGKNVYPEEIEYNINNIQYVLESMVYGDETESGQDTKIVASIRLDDEVVAELFQDISKEEIEKKLWEDIEMINEKEPMFKKVKKIVIKENDFIKNTSKKIKRHAEENKVK